MRKYIFEVCAAAAALAFLFSGRVTLQQASRSIDYDLLLVLFALLVTVEILRASGSLDRAVALTVSRFDHTRSFGAMLIVTTGLLVHGHGEPHVGLRHRRRRSPRGDRVESHRMPD